MYLYDSYRLGAPPDAVAARTAKSQQVRVLDVAVIGPLMVWGGFKLGGVGGAALTFFGVTTIAYNGWNYGRVARGEVC